MRSLALLALVPLLFQGKPPDLHFEDYPAGEVFRGTPAAPKIVEPWARMFRTAIRNGVSKGWGVNHFDEPQVKLDGPQAYPYPRGNEHEGPNFAGHYFVITWGCGTGCLGIVVVDAITGRIFPPPLSIDKRNPLAIPQFGMYSALFDYRVDSRLFAMSTCTETTKPSKLACRISYFIMEDNGFKLIKNVDLPDMSLTVEP